MDEKLKRGWFRFRLSTVLILTAILACGMAIGFTVTIFIAEPPAYWMPRRYARLNPKLIGPALALAAFLAWKAAWVVVERRRRLSAAAEPNLQQSIAPSNSTRWREVVGRASWPCFGL